MTTGWTLVEPCCGSGALTLHMLGARSSLVPYQGTKWSLRQNLDAQLVRLGAWGAPSRVVLSDASWWACVVATVLRDREAVARALLPMVVRGESDANALYADLQSALVPADPIERAAVLLWLQRMSYSGKAVGDADDRWIVHGISKTSAYGIEATERFGAVPPLGRALLKAVNRAPQTQHVECHRGLAPVVVTGPTVVYLDPPYAGTQGYPSGGLTREQVAEYAMAWFGEGAHVVVSEAGPVEQLVSHGWRAERIRGPSRDQGRQTFRRATHGEEWVTVSPMGEP